MVYLSSDGVCLLHKKGNMEDNTERKVYCCVTLLLVDSPEVYSGPL